jgi:Glycosyltransferase
MKNFLTLFPECKNIELIKDVCQIPYILGKEHELETAVVVSDNLYIPGNNLEYVKGLNIIKIPMIMKNKNITGLLYILKHAKKIDWLNLYHCGRASFYETKLFKFLNPNGKVYLKLDMDFRSCDLLDTNKRERKIFLKNMDIMDLVTVETELVRKRIQKYSSTNIQIIGNGYCKTEEIINVKGKRDNVFLTVGRLGSQQKGTEILLEAFAKSAEKHNWKLKLVGSIENHFRPFIDSYYKLHPELINRVIFTGEILKREKLYSTYCKSKVFILPSRWEGFPIVSGECLSCGCKVIVSDQVPAQNEMTRKGKYGLIIPVNDINALSNAMVEISKTKFSPELSAEISEYANKQFSWSIICNKLYNLLMNHK